MAHVFIVDDDPGIREVLRSALEAEGHVVTEAADGVSALVGLRSSPCPLVVSLDLRMPRLDGAGVLEAVAREQALAQRHRFVLITANPFPLLPALGALLVSLGVPVLSKPFDVDTLLGMVALLADEVQRAPANPGRARGAAATACAHPGGHVVGTGAAGAAVPRRSLPGPGSREARPKAS
jgi:two-component system, OmpR family, response regulator